MTTKQTFIVEGRGDFPDDMQRYDECAPLHYADSVVAKERGLRLVSMSGNRLPTVARWESFGWKVVAINGRVVAEATAA